MNYLSIEHASQLNQPGLSCVLFVSGCSHKCRQCQNSYSWDPECGIKFDQQAKEEIFNQISQPWCKKLTLSGGDPLYIHNRAEIIELAKEVKEKYPDTTIWCYTGYTYEEVLNDDTMKDILLYIDVLVDGKFDFERKNYNYHWAGSTNQKIINIKAMNGNFKDVIIFDDGNDLEARPGYKPIERA